ncbi:hypothetical protein LFYK43_01540 [Ligilactobacillus salitolerans]|uniref:DUF4867 domain-containing protein n=1 Tax=Ligilactobacillus salitolerans TaxID=1808352 RepID=A0A401IQA7_9LACO|nr:DUF4867 family protein [Ligilactobacillus salitolerans]GBG93695.1 hypothetical protein LFYK43_01540 [Ligilactobacillus salitolerans]
MTKYEELCQKNSDYQIQAISAPSFSKYGKIYTDYDISEIVKYMDNNISIDPENNVYVPSNAELEAIPAIQTIGTDIFADLPIEAGECTGQSLNFTAVEYHQGSELNIFLTDVVMVLGKRSILEENGTFNAKEEAELFYVPRGTVVEFYSDTLHYSPIKVDAAGFKIIVMLPAGSNQELPENFHSNNLRIVKRNKFQVVHESRKDKIAQGAQIGVTGDLIELKAL